MTETKYHLINSIFNSCIQLNSTNSKEYVKSEFTIGNLITILQKNKVEFNISDDDISDYYRCYQYYIDTNIRKMLDGNLTNIIVMFNAYNNILNYLLEYKPFDKAIYDFKMIKFIYFKHEISVDKFIIIKELSYNNTALNKLKLVKLLRTDDYFTKEFLKLEREKRND